MRKFLPKNKNDELLLVSTDDANFSKTKEYLIPLIETVLDRMELKPLRYKQLKDELIADIPVAAKRFLSNIRNIERGYKFSTYFSWYISERVNKEED